MAEMSYIARSAKPLAETVTAVQEASAHAGWTVLATHDMKQRFENKGLNWETGLTIVEICQSKYASRMVEMNPRLALHLPCPIVVREDEDGVEVAVLRPNFVSGLFPETAFGDAAGLAETEVIAIIDAAVA